jgi:DNA-binding transcriptional LysR family regulator
MSDAPEPLRVGFVPGVTPDKWARRWREQRSHGPLDLVPLAEDDDPVALLSERALDLCLVRLPVDTEGLHVVRLYDEVPVVLVSREHPVAAYDEVDVSDLVDEHLLQDGDAVPAMTAREAVESVAADAGVMIVPLSVARLHHRRDVVAVPVTGVPQTTVVLVWPVAHDDERRQAFVGVVKGRTPNSSRG